VSPEESISFIDVLCTAFPEFKIIGERSPNFERTKKSWAVAWTDLTLEECRKVVVQLAIDGQIGYDDYRTPGPFIRKLVIAHRNRGKTSEAERAESAILRATGAYQGSPMAKALADAIRMKGEGKPEAEIMSAIDRAIPPAAAWDGPRHHCPICCDRQTVVVWRADFVAKVVSGQLDIEKLTRAHTYVISCYCSAANDANQRRNKKLPVYSTAGFCLYLDNGDDQQRLRSWIQEKKQGKEWAA
jgi:hypothetical protein